MSEQVPSWFSSSTFAPSSSVTMRMTTLSNREGHEPKLGSWRTSARASRALIRTRESSIAVPRCRARSTPPTRGWCPSLVPASISQMESTCGRFPRIVFDTCLAAAMAAGSSSRNAPATGESTANTPLASRRRSCGTLSLRLQGQPIALVGELGVRIQPCGYNPSSRVRRRVHPARAMSLRQLFGGDGRLGLPRAGPGLKGPSETSSSAVVEGAGAPKISISYSPRLTDLLSPGFSSPRRRSICCSIAFRIAAEVRAWMSA